MAGAMTHRALCWLTLACLTGWAAPLYASEWSQLSRVEKSVVRISVKTECILEVAGKTIPDEDCSSSGSGTVLNANGDVLTNEHVSAGVKVGEVMVVVERNGRPHPVTVKQVVSKSLFVISEFSNGEQPAQIVWESEEKDLALIRVPSLNLPAASLFTGELKKTAVVRAMGYPGVSDQGGSRALDATVTQGEISRIFDDGAVIDERHWNATVVQHTAGINAGNSGGPLFDNCGRVVGVNTAGPNPSVAEETNWASHIKEAIALLRARGIDFSEDSSPCVPAASGAGVDEQARVTAEEAGTKADEAGDKADDAVDKAGDAVDTAKDAVDKAGAAADAAEKAVHANRLTNTLVGLVAVVTLVALGLALRKPRQEIIRVAGHVAEKVAEPLSRLAQSVQSVRRKKPDIALTGFDARGRPVTLMLSRDELDTQQGGFTVGRHPLLVDHVLDGDRLSKRHARFSGGNGSVFVEDLNSSNGTSINGTACSPFQPMQIRPGDTVDVGDIALRVSS